MNTHNICTTQTGVFYAQVIHVSDGSMKLYCFCHHGLIWPDGITVESGFLSLDYFFATITMNHIVERNCN